MKKSDSKQLSLATASILGQAPNLMILINGEQCENIQVLDRGFQYGDGIFETIEIYQGRPVFLEKHLERLKNASLILKIPFPDLKLLKREALLLASNTSSSAVLKLILTRGTGGRGYRQPEKIQATRVLSLHAFPDYPENNKIDGITARFCQHQLGLNPTLAGIKHLNRLEQVMARAEWSDDNIQEGLMLNCYEQVIEGTMSNFFVVKDKLLLTPKLDQCGISGIIRNQILAIAKDYRIEAQEAQITRMDVFDADELFVTNSIIGVWPIKQFEYQHYKIGSLTRRIQSLLDQKKHQDLAQYD